MNIKKKSVKAAENMTDLEPVLAPETDFQPEEEMFEDESICSYDECIEHIHEAIDCLAVCAKDDPVAKEAIANLSVVLLDLQN